MNYDDFLLPGQAEFEKLAKAYSSQKRSMIALENPDINPAILDSICYSLKYLNWLYTYIKRNLRNNKLRSVFENFAKQTDLDFIEIEKRFYDEPKIIKLTKSRHLNSLNSCVRLAIYSEAELVANMINLFKCGNFEFAEPIIFNHIEYIKKLSTI